MSQDEFSDAFSTAFDPAAAPVAAGCVPYDIDEGCCDGWATYDPALQARAIELAWATLRHLSGGRVGNCPVIVRPCLTAPCECCAGGWMNPVVVAGEWFNCVCGTDVCSCTRLCEIVLPGEVAEILEVNFSGQPLDLHDYRVDNGHRLVRMDGGCWPSCQNMGAPAGATDTLTITYVPGVAPGASGSWAAGVLACEFAKACSGGKCRLPTSVTAIARQGVSMTMASSMFEGGMTGIREVDAYLLTVNPNHLKQPSLVWSPDLPAVRHRYQTWMAPL